jgi:hypothetical protein
VFGSRIPVNDPEVTELNYQGQLIGPAEVTLVAAATSTLAASVEVIKLDGNPIGFPSKVSVRPGAETGVDVKEGVFAAVDERRGEVNKVHPGGTHATLRWLDDGSTSGWTEIGGLTSIVALRADLIEDYSHIKALGEAISSSPVKEISLAQCQFTSATLTTFVQSVRWDTAALTSIVLDGQPLSGSVPGKQPHSGRESFEEFGVDKADADMSGFKLLCEALASSQVQVISMQSCYLGPQALTSLTDAIKVMAALTKVDLRGNEVDKESMDALRSAAPHGCEILFGEEELAERIT